MATAARIAIAAIPTFRILIIDFLETQPVYFLWGEAQGPFAASFVGRLKGLFSFEGLGALPTYTPPMESLGKTLVASGIIIALIGAWIWWSPGTFRLGRLPGDIAIQRDGFSFY